MTCYLCKILAYDVFHIVLCIIFYLTIYYYTVSKSNI